MNEVKKVPIAVAHLFRPLDKKLIELLESLSPEDWDQQTVARHWKVKDVAAHLLDGNIRALSIQRDGYFGERAPVMLTYEDLVNWLNQINADWIKASRRISPGVLIHLHRMTGELVSDYFESLDPLDEAVFPVSWAGEIKSLNWMHLAREYTEKWHHQQQIREAIGRDGIMTREMYYPVLDTFFRALPYTFREVDAKIETAIEATVAGESGGSWTIVRGKEGWLLTSESIGKPTARVTLPQDVAWKLFSKSVRPAEIKDKVKLEGDHLLAAKALEMVSVMA